MPKAMRKSKQYTYASHKPCFWIETRQNAMRKSKQQHTAMQKLCTKD